MWMDHICTISFLLNECEYVLYNNNHFALGLVYTYLAGHVGRMGEQGAFRALTRGYTHWASGLLQELEVNTNHPEFVHVRITMKPSMKDGVYRIYLLLGRDGELATICSATCECAAG